MPSLEGPVLETLSPVLLWGFHLGLSLFYLVPSPVGGLQLINPISNSFHPSRQPALLVGWMCSLPEFGWGRNPQGL